MSEAPDASKGDGIVRILNPKFHLNDLVVTAANFTSHADGTTRQTAFLTEQHPPFPRLYTNDANPCKGMLR
jgi:hypothetical protein